MYFPMTQWCRTQWHCLLALLLILTPMLLTHALAAGPLSARDRSYLKDIARINLLQTEASKLAAFKSNNENILDFAREMLTEQVQITEQLRQFAQGKQTELPDEPSLWQKAKFRRLSAKEGEEFDQRYAKAIGIKSQEEMVKLLDKTALRADDPDLKAFARQRLPALESRLETAKALYAIIEAIDDKE